MVRRGKGQGVQKSSRRTDAGHGSDDATLAAYLNSVREWHGYIRFLGLPSLRENPDVRIDRLYVQPRLADRSISPDTPPTDWPATESVLETLASHRRLVILGDPGSGKSTLVSWLAWQFARQAESDWTERLGPLVPLPMILRELGISRDITWPGLLDAFRAHDMCKSLRDGTHIESWLEEGRALVMLDGLDEIGSTAARAALRDAVFEGMETYPDSLWLSTSRVVGYEDAQFDRRMTGNAHRRGGLPSIDLHVLLEESNLDRTISSVLSRETMAEVRYVAPFTDDQIAQFAGNWYRQREAVESEAAKQARGFIDAVKGDGATHRLARVPNLLTIMALIYRVRARLPNGRALLYDEIVEAYLQSIDEFRGLQEADYPLAHKKKWLARVGFEMQRQRLSRGPDEEEDRETQGEILATDDEVTGWISAAMAESGRGGDAGAAAEFVGYIGRRSGLLLPRGAGRFAFMHLSFQEYFAACFLVDQVTSPPWLLGLGVAAGADAAALRDDAWAPAWRETLVFLFELLADRTGWVPAVAERMYREGFDGLAANDMQARPAAVLLARLATDPHSGFAQDMREAALAACARWEAARLGELEPGTHARWGYDPEVARALLAAEPEQRPLAWRALVAAFREAGPRAVSLRGCATVTELGDLAGLDLAALDLTGTGVTDLGSLGGLSKLRVLFLDRTGVTDLGPLGGLSKLETLYLSMTGVTDLGPLGGLSNLETLVLDGTGVTDLAPLGGLSKLGMLVLDGTGVTDLGPLGGLSKLETLFLSGNGVTDLGPLRGLSKLAWLDLSETGVTDLAPLGGLSKLVWLDLSETSVTDLGPLGGLSKLETIHLSGTGVTDLGPLGGLSELKMLSLTGTGVTDPGPLDGLSNLAWLSLSGTGVTDLGPLGELSNLRILFLPGTGVTEEQIEELRRALPDAKIHS